MSSLVVDASAVVEYLLRTERGREVEPSLTSRETALHVPALCDVEVTAALRRGILLGALAEPRAEQALTAYLDLPLTRHGHQALLRRALSLRENFTAYDAVYVALAERLDAPLLTADARLARACHRIGLRTL
ncbi:MAG: type II toxin-antitoxin system VapC family toxin [Gemmatimonadetes bacterium]|nr:type II toxin-antitoxin system VapC family toxin [Gemmatimonadota bacterium]